MTHWQMYWLTRLDGVVGVLVVITVMTLVIALIAAIVTTADDEFKEQKRWIFKLVAIGMIAMAFSVFIPTTKEMAAIIIVPKIINNEKIQELPENLLELSNEWIKAKTKELKEGE